MLVRSLTWAISNIKVIDMHHGMNISISYQNKKKFLMPLRICLTLLWCWLALIGSLFDTDFSSEEKVPVKFSLKFWRIYRHGIATIACCADIIVTIDTTLLFFNYIFLLRFYNGNREIYLFLSNLKQLLDTIVLKSEFYIRRQILRLG